MKIEAVDLRRISMPMIAPFRVSFGVETHRDVLLVRVIGRDAEGWGECVAMARAALLVRVRRRRRSDVIRDHLCRGCSRPATSPPTRSAGVLAPGQGSSRWPRRRSRWRCSTPSCAPPARRSPRDLGAVRDRGRLRGVGRHHGRDPGSCSTPSAATSTRATCASSSRSSRAGTSSRSRAVRERFGDDVLLQVDANTAYTLADARAPGRARPVRPAADRAAAGRGRHARPRRAGAADRDADLPRRVDRLGRGRRGARSARRLPRSSTSSPAGSAATSRRGAIHDVCVAHGVPVWCGGMLETGLGRAANVALGGSARLHAARRHVGVGPLLRAGHHRAVRPRRRPARGAAGPGARCRRRSRRSSTSSRPRSAPSGQRALCHRASSPSSRNCSSSTRRSSAFFTSMSKSSPRRRSR